MRGDLDGTGIEIHSRSTKLLSSGSKNTRVLAARFRGLPNFRPVIIPPSTSNELRRQTTRRINEDYNFLDRARDRNRLRNEKR